MLCRLVTISLEIRILDRPIPLPRLLQLWKGLNFIHGLFEFGHV